MEKQQKTLHVYYKGCEQRIKVYDGTKEDKIIKMIKRLFKITASDEQIFFQDENGDIIILPEAFPQDLSFYVYIRPEYPEITKSIENKNTMGQKNLFQGSNEGEICVMRGYLMMDISSMQKTILEGLMKLWVRLNIQKENYFVNYSSILQIT